MSLPVHVRCIKSSAPPNQDPIAGLYQHFKSTYNHVEPQFVVAVPGRVNLIGEHIDYHGFAVLPMAIEKRIYMAVATRICNHNTTHCINDSKFKFASVRLTNLQSHLYQSTKCDDIETNYNGAGSPEWHHYFLCGYRGVIEQMHAHLNPIGDSLLINAIQQTELLIAVSGDIPPSSGLSSSSAMVCAAAIAVKYALNSIIDSFKSSPLEADLLERIQNIDKLQMAADCASFERFIGTQGGGMDQAIAFLGEQGTARLIEFYPKLSCQSVSLPDQCAFFVAHCGQTLNKAATTHYNRRVFETRTAAILLGRHLADKQCKPQSRDLCITLREVMQHYHQSFEQMIALIPDVLSPGATYTLDQLFRLLSINSTQQLTDLLRMPRQRIEMIVACGDDQNNEFNLHDRALHVFAEASRVYQMQQLSINTALDTHERLQRIGKLLNDSHHSCSHLYKCSSQALDQLVDKALQAGAYGARLTGAGWGGCIIAMVCKNKADHFLEQMNKHSQFVFQTQPAHGAAVYQLQIECD